jgi:hypothetical protein
MVGTDCDFWGQIIKAIAASALLSRVTWAEGSPYQCLKDMQAAEKSHMGGTDTYHQESLSTSSSVSSEETLS